MGATAPGETGGRESRAAAAPYVILLGEDGTWFRRDYERAFVEAGFEVAFVPTETAEDGEETGLPGDGLAHARARVRRRLLALASGRSPALLFAYAFDRTLDAATLRIIRRLPCPSVLLQVDMVGQWYHVVRSCSAFTLVAAAQREHAEALRRRGARVLVWPMAGFATQPDWTTPRPAVVRFVGTPSAARVEALGSLVDAAVPVEIFGHWPMLPASLMGDAGPAPRRAASLFAATLRRARRALHTLPALIHEEGLGRAVGLKAPSLRTSYDATARLQPHLRGPAAASELSRVLAGGQVSLGCTDTAIGSGHRSRQMRLRDFEAPLAGACYLTQESEGLADCFALGREVLVWDSPQDLVQRSRELLADPGRCLEVARAGWARASRDHTYEARLRVLFARLGACCPEGLR